MFSAASGPQRHGVQPGPSTMGETSSTDGGYIDYGGPDGMRERRRGDSSEDHAPSERTTSTAPLKRGGAAGAAGTATYADNDKGSFVSGDSSDRGSLDAAYAAGMPIGLLAALGTPYAKKPIYRSKKCKVLCLAIVPITIIVVMVLTAFPILKAIADHALRTSIIHVYVSNITSPTDAGFGLTLEGQVKKTGIFPAHIAFERPADVYWINPDNQQELYLGQLPFAALSAAAGHAKLKQQTYFAIQDLPGFGRFTEFLITQESFTWQIRSDKVQAKAFGFLAANNLKFRKDLTIKGIANFTDVSITQFQLPGNDPAGGITVAATTKLTNPSPFGVEIGTLGVDLYYDGLFLGPAETFAPINLTNGVNEISLGGHLVDHTGDPVALQKLGVVFSNYLNGVATPVQAVGRSVTLADGTTPSWLLQGIQALILNVPLASPTGRISPIKSISIEEFNLQFTPESAYAPLASSPRILGGIGLPFGFTLNISQVATTINIIQNNTLIAGVVGSFGGSVTNIQTQNAGFTTGLLTLELPPAPLIVEDSYVGHRQFEQFTSDVATTDGSRFFLNGTANALTSTPIGQVLLTDVGFTVPAGLVGLSSLTLFPTLILSVDVTGGTPDYVIVAIQVGLTNPSNINLAVTDVIFQLFAPDGAYLGRTTLPDLQLGIGFQEKPAIGQLLANDNPTALQVLNDFANGRDNLLSISGFNGSTAVPSLGPAFGNIHLNATLGGLQPFLLNNARLTVLPTSGRENNIVHTVVDLQNPFSSPLLITNIQANVSARGQYLGSITVDTQFNALGNQANLSPELDFVLNLYPPTVFSLLRQLVQESGQDVLPLDGVVQLGQYTYLPTTGPDPPSKGIPSSRPDVRTVSFKRDLEQQLSLEYEEDFVAGDFGREDFADLLMRPLREAGAPEEFIKRAHQPRSDLRTTFESRTGQTIRRRILKRQANIYNGFDLPSYVLRAFAQLTVNVDLVSVVNIGEFVTALTYSQTGVPTLTDTTLNLLLPVLAQPIVQKIVDGAVLTVDSILITDPQLNSFGTGLTGSITNAGPFNAVINFPQGLSVSWNGGILGQIAMPNVSLVGDVGAALDLQAGFSVADVGLLTTFTGYLLNTDSFTWQIFGQNLLVTALGISVDGISIMKEVVLSGMNGFKGDVTINAFDLPANDPAGGLTLTIDSSLTNRASVGVQLAALTFDTTFGSTFVGPVSAANPFTLTPKSTFALPLAGRLVPQQGQGLQDLSTIFNGFVHGVPSNLVVTGVTAGPPGVTWLNDGIKQLNIPVVLPAAQNLQIINSISLYQLTLQFTPETAYNPAFTTDNTVAEFQLPFAFPLDITNLAAQITPEDQGRQFALLDVPSNPSDTNPVVRNIILRFANVPFAVFDDGRSIFSQFLTDTTVGTTKTFGLSGAADSVAETAIGALNINGIPFSVQTTIAGLQGLNAQRAFVTELDVFRGVPEFLQINANTHLFNPSNISLGVSGEILFALSFRDVVIGRAVLNDLFLVPGENVVPTEVRYMPMGDAVPIGQNLLENFVQRIVSTAAVFGDDQTTAVESLTQALAALRLEIDIPPLQQNLVTQAVLVLPVDIVQTSIANANFDLDNPFTASINLINLYANATYGDLNLGLINEQGLNPPISAPGKTKITSPFLPFLFNLDPRVIINLLLRQADVNGVNLGPLPEQFAFVLGLSDDALANITGDIQTTVDLPNILPQRDFNPACVSGRQFPVFQAILDSLVGLLIELPVRSTVGLDEYITDLNFLQSNVPAITDETALYLIGAVGRPIVQNLVDQATLSFSAGNITGVTDTGFSVALSGTLGNTGPFDALIQTPEPGITVTWEGRDIAVIILQDICAFADISVPQLETSAQLTITDLGAFTDFAIFILANPSFTWVVHTDRIIASALGTIFDNVGIAKVISFLAFNRLPGVTIMNFNLPRDGDDGQSIVLETDANIPSPSNLGIELGTANFIASFMGNTVGPVAAQNLFLFRLTTTMAFLQGLIIRQEGDSIRTIGILFSMFLQGIDQTIQVTGDSVITPAQPDRPVNWLSTAFKTLTLDVILPGMVYEIIRSITINDFELVLQSEEEDFAIDTSNELTNAVFRNPFGFSLTIAQVATDITLGFTGTDTATISTPLADPLLSETSTGQDARLDINFQNRTLAVIPGTEATYQAFIAQVADQASADFTLGGSANVTTSLTIGPIPISGIPFGVPSTFQPAINSFRGGPIDGVIIADTPLVVGSGAGTPESRYVTVGTDGPSGNAFIRINLGVQLFNPADVTLATNNVALPVYYVGSALAFVGRAVVTPLNLVPGTNSLQAQFQYAPTTLDAVSQDLVTQYLYANPAVPIRITAAPGPADRIPSSTYDSLAPALDGLAALDGTFPGLETALVDDIEIFLSLTEGLCDSTASITLTLNNNLQAPVTLRRVINRTFQPSSPGGVDVRTNPPADGDTTIQYASFDHQFAQPYLSPPGGVNPTYSEPVLVQLTKGVAGSFPLLFKQDSAPRAKDGSDGLYLVNSIATTVGDDGGTEGFLLPSLVYNQNRANYHINLFLTGDSEQLAAANPQGGGDTFTPQGFIAQLTQPASLIETIGQILTGQCAGISLDSVCGLLGGIFTLLGQDNPLIGQVCQGLANCTTLPNELLAGITGDPLNALTGLITSLAQSGQCIAGQFTPGGALDIATLCAALNQALGTLGQAAGAGLPAPLSTLCTDASAPLLTCLPGAQLTPDNAAGLQAGLDSLSCVSAGNTNVIVGLAGQTVGAICTTLNTFGLSALPGPFATLCTDAASCVQDATATDAATILDLNTLITTVGCTVDGLTAGLLGADAVARLCALPALGTLLQPVCNPVASSSAELPTDLSSAVNTVTSAVGEVIDSVADAVPTDVVPDAVPAAADTATEAVGALTEALAPPPAETPAAEAPAPADAPAADPTTDAGVIQQLGLRRRATPVAVADQPTPMPYRGPVREGQDDLDLLIQNRRRRDL